MDQKLYNKTRQVSPQKALDQELTAKAKQTAPQQPPHEQIVRHVRNTFAAITELEIFAAGLTGDSIDAPPKGSPEDDISPALSHVLHHIPQELANMESRIYKAIEKLHSALYE